MRVFHFLNEQWGLKDIRLRRLKIATIGELNDPFELLGVDLRDPDLRHAVQQAKAEFARVRGLLCFSKDWHNPVQWSHYADRHRGLCLGFDIPDNNDFVRPIDYSAKRFLLDVLRLAQMAVPDPVVFEKFLFTKYRHWRYEKEVRAIVPLSNPENGKYYFEFSSDMALRCVIVGAFSSITRQTLRRALGSLAPHVETSKARLAFQTFRVVRQNDPSLWI